MCVVEKPSGGHPVFSATDSCSVVLTTLIPGAALEAAPTDQMTTVLWCLPVYYNNAKPPLSSLGAPLLGCSCGPQECTVVVDRTVCVWEFEVMWDCREHMSWPVVIHPQILVSVQRWFIGQHGPARGDFLVPFTYCYCGVSIGIRLPSVGSFVGWLVGSLKPTSK